MSVFESGASVKVTTDDFPEGKRLAMWREVYGRTIAKFDIEPLDDTPFHAEVTFRSLPRIGVATGARSDAHYRMTRSLAAQSGDNLVFSIVTQGMGTICQFGREATIETGSAVLLSASDPSVCTIRQHGQFMTLSLPRELVVPLLADVDTAFVRPILQTSEALQLLTGYLRAVTNMSSFAAPNLAQRAANHITDLAIMAIGATRDAAAVAGVRGVPAARLRAIKADIFKNLTDRALSIDTVALRHGITPRYVAMLFDNDATTFSEFVLMQRLIQAHRTLIDRRFWDRTVSSIAFESGFGDLSYFNRAFRRLYGATPSDVREKAQQENGGS